MPIKYPTGGTGAGGGGSGDVATDAIWDAKGDLAAGTGANTAARLAVGANGLKLKAASAAATGVKWDGGFTNTLPVSPVAGDEYFWLVDNTNHIVWHMLYDGTRWLFLGGAPLYAVVETSQTTTTTGSFLDLTTAGPSITLPLAGVYEFIFGAYMSHTATGINVQAALSIDGAVPDATNDVLVTTGAGSASGGSPARTIRVAVATPATPIKMQYRISGAGTGSFARRWMAVRPVTI